MTVVTVIGDDKDVKGGSNEMVVNGGLPKLTTEKSDDYRCALVDMAAGVDEMGLFQEISVVLKLCFLNSEA